MKIINLTPHKLRLYNDNFTLIEVIESSGVARATQENTPIGNIGEYPLSRVKYGEVKDFPSSKKDTFYVVSQITAAALKQQGRMDDILIVDKTVRSDNGNLNIKTGQIVGCMGFAKI